MISGPTPFPGSSVTMGLEPDAGWSACEDARRTTHVFGARYRQRKCDGVGGANRNPQPGCDTNLHPCRPCDSASRRAIRAYQLDSQPNRARVQCSAVDMSSYHHKSTCVVPPRYQNPSSSYGRRRNIASASRSKSPCIQSPAWRRRTSRSWKYGSGSRKRRPVGGWRAKAWGSSGMK